MAATHTPNLNLAKPDREDFVSVVSDINDNMDILDNSYGALSNQMANVGEGTFTPSTGLTATSLIYKNNKIVTVSIEITLPSDLTPGSVLTLGSISSGFRPNGTVKDGSWLCNSNNYTVLPSMFIIGTSGTVQLYVPSNWTSSTRYLYIYATFVCS